ncbi:MAG TPA: type 4a pilus biogenesis protein PilO [Candidatus Omnitrophota bacterium]|nr:type 4a pilus biogenesis protein PilO [Candidatus Omnitrophota bacterium]HPD85317.1 type 4a pilus biogenesis protein PilO [Candidatus Omnitrophota bacterium]HRZ04182.1 type 4a pilus biogenesis protein PilO [Candidatus Omnitrophota bacterium]
MITLKDLSEYDVKNLDIKKIVQNIRQSRELMINIVIVFTTFFLAIQIIDKSSKEISSLKIKVADLEKMSKAITEYKNADEALTLFLNASPKGLTETEAIINKINNYAIKHDIQILSFTPAQQENRENLKKTGVTFDFKANRYEDIGLFIYDIENADYNFRIEQWSASSAPPTNLREDEQAKAMKATDKDINPIAVNMKIASIELKR